MSWPVYIWDPNPYMHVYVGDGIQIDAIEIPSGVEVLEIADLQARYAKCLSSSDRTVRGWSCSHIANLNPYDAQSLEKIAAKLHDDDWVKSNAAGAISLFTGMPGEGMEKLKAVKTDNDQLQKKIQKSIELLQSAEPNEAACKQFQQSLAAIRVRWKTARDTLKDSGSLSRRTWASAHWRAGEKNYGSIPAP